MKQLITLLAMAFLMANPPAYAQSVTTVLEEIYDNDNPGSWDNYRRIRDTLDQRDSSLVHYSEVWDTATSQWNPEKSVRRTYWPSGLLQHDAQFSWNLDSGKFLLTKESEYHYNSASKRDSVFTNQWTIPGGSSPDRWYEKTSYNSAGQTLERITKRDVHQNSTWFFTLRNRFVYDQLGQNFTYYSEHRDSVNQNWRLSATGEYYRSANGRVDSFEYFFGPSTQFILKVLYNYNSSGQQSAIHFYDNTNGNGSLELIGKNEFNYTPAGDLESVYLYDWDGNTASWIPTFRYLYIRQFLQLEEAIQTVQFYPNPSNGWIRLATDRETTVVLYDLSGREIFQKNSHAAGEVLNLTFLPKGTYVIELRTPQKSERGLIVLREN